MDNTISGNFTATGTLMITVFTASGAIPIEGALVSIRGSVPEQSGVMSVVYTDRSGRTPKVTLPAPPASESTSPGVEKPYATYNIDVDKEGYYPRSYINVPIFAGTTSIQPVNLLPLSEYPGEGDIPEDKTVTENQNPDL